MLSDRLSNQRRKTYQTFAVKTLIEFTSVTQKKKEKSFEIQDNLKCSIANCFLLSTAALNII